MTAKRKALLGVAAACSAVAGLTMPAATRAYAQSPSPNNDFLGWCPGSVQ